MAGDYESVIIHIEKNDKYVLNILDALHQEEMTGEEAKEIFTKE